MNKDFDILIKEKEKKEIKEENEDSIEEESITKKIPQKDLKVKVEPILLWITRDNRINKVRFDKTDRKKWSKDSKLTKDDEEIWE